MPHGPATGPVLQTLNATPMMDVMLVLLVIFMVVTPLIHSRPDLILLSASNGDPPPENEVLTIRLSLTSELSSEAGVLSSADLARFLERHPEVHLMIEADRRLPYGEVEHVLASIREAGVRQASLIVANRGKRP